MFTKENPGKGRPKGVVNKTTQEARQHIRIFMDKITPEVLAMYRKLQPVEQMRFYLDLLPYVCPKMQSVEMSGEVAIKPMVRELPGLTVEQLEQVRAIEESAIKHLPLPEA